MKRESEAQFTLAESLLGYPLGLNETLARIDTLVKWYRFEKLLGRLHVAETGRPAYPVLTMIDATLVEAAVRPPPRPQDGEAEEEPSDADAGFAKRAGKSGSTYGFKAHVAVDQGSQLVRTALLTPANVNETVVADGLIQGDEGAVYADAAYDTRARRALLKARAIKDRIMHRPNKHHPDLPPGQRRRNRFISRIRARVETIFAILKRHYGYVRVRYIGLVKNQSHLHLQCIALNLRRAVVLTS